MGQQFLRTDLAAVIDDQQRQQLRQATEHRGEHRRQRTPPGARRTGAEGDDQPQREPWRHAGQRQGQGDQGTGEQGHAPTAFPQGKESQLLEHVSDPASGCPAGAGHTAIDQ
ncbi:hypothetical protein D3C84_947390 [compost metagenome]